jgi:hypothetical protein
MCRSAYVASSINSKLQPIHPRRAVCSTRKQLITYPLFPSFLGSVRSLHRSQHSCSLYRMRVPVVHLVPAPPQLSHLLHAIHELLHPKLLQEEVAGGEKGRLRD